MTGVTNIWSILIILGATQGLFLSLYLFIKQQNRDANKWIALLLVFVSLHLFEYSADITGFSLEYPVLIAITYPLIFCMGPLYYIYCRHLLDKSYSVSTKTWLHFMPSIGVLLMMLPFYAMPDASKTDFVEGLSEGGRLQVPIEQFIFMGIHVLQTASYVLAAHRFIGTKKRELMGFSSDVLAMKKLEWLSVFNLYFSIYLILYLAVVIILTLIDSYHVEVDYFMLLITSVSIYAIGYSALSKPEVFEPTPEPDVRGKRIGAQPDAAKASELKEKLRQIMEQNKPFLKSDLKLSELADLLSVPAYQLSQLINEEFFVNFYDFVNKYRIEEAKKLLVEDANDFKILAVAFEVGFSSKATFNRAFKKFTDHTPTEFKSKFSSDRS